MKPLLSIFIDGLKIESLQYMPFLNSFTNKNRIKGEFGYSIACHGSMYSGVHTDIHKLWFVWQRSPSSSPFRKIRHLAGLPFMKTLPGKLFLHKTATLFEKEKNTSFFGIPRVVHVAPQFLKYLDVTEKRNYDESGYLTEVKSLFDILKEEDIPLNVIGMDKSEHEESRILSKVNHHLPVPWTYWFIGDVDHFSHEFGQDSHEAKKRLLALDQLLSKKYQQFISQIGEVDTLIWSDHGHIDIDERIDIYKTFSLYKEKLDDFQHVIDGNFARFWFKNASQENVLRKILSEELKNSGDILEVDDQKTFRVYPGDNRFGDLIFALRPGKIFSKTIWGWSRKMKSMHGYNPNFPQSDGVIISNLPLQHHRKLNLIDITPSILTRLGVPLMDYMEGKSFWR